MSIKLGIVSDPISGFNIKKDTGFVMGEAHDRHWLLRCGLQQGRRRI